MHKIKLIGYCVMVLLIMQGCKQKGSAPVVTDSVASGTAKFAVDESFEPIVAQEAYVFKTLNPAARPQFAYAPEADVARMLVNDDARLVIMSRDLDTDEVAALKKRNLTAAVNRFALDAVAIIVNKVSNDTTITVSQLKQMLNGQAKTNLNIVFDNPSSSLVRYLKALSGNQEFKLNKIFALKSNKEVIKYVSTHPQAIGITGFSWLDDPDADYADAVNNVKIVAVKNEASKKYPNEYFKPSQTTLALKQYPLSRSLNVINCTGRMGLGTGFAMFLTSERGQRIILRSGLLPDSIPEREISVKHTFKEK